MRSLLQPKYDPKIEQAAREALPPEAYRRALDWVLRERGVGVGPESNTWDPWLVHVPKSARGSSAGERIYYLYQAEGDLDQGTEFWAYSRLGTAWKPEHPGEQGVANNASSSIWVDAETVSFAGWLPDPKRVRFLAGGCVYDPESRLYHLFISVATTGAVVECSNWPKF